MLSAVEDEGAIDLISGKTGMWTIAILLVITSAILFALRLRQTGLSTRTPPGPFERLAAKQIRRWLVPIRMRKETNPLAANAETLKQGMDHWADHCATCHANNGSGDTEMGRNFYPPAPDMRNAETQSLSDGELYYIIRNGVPLTGMPAWGDPRLGNSDSQTWALVSFIRHLPTLTPGEVAGMQKLNPKSATEREEEQEEEDFLNGPSNTKLEPNTRRKQ
jgi:mono/diheme cytochrome c family protein